MPLLSFKVSSNLDLVKCRELIKKHENSVIPLGVSFREQLTKNQPAIYDFHWSDEKILYLSRWWFRRRRGAPAVYWKGIELITRIEGTSSDPIFFLQTQDGTWKKIISASIFGFFLLEAVTVVISLFAMNKVTPAAWLFLTCSYLLLCTGFFFNVLINALLCRRFLKRLINPKKTEV
jgi:hypothetical protein